MTTDETAISQQICPTCPLESCNDRSPECPLRAFMSESWLKLNPVQKQLLSPEEKRERRLAIQRRYEQSPKRKARVKARKAARQARQAQQAQGPKTVKRYTAEERREYFRDYKRLRKARELQSV